MKIDLASLEGALEVLGQLLADRGLHYEVVAIGGGSLLLLGLIKLYASVDQGPQSKHFTDLCALSPSPAELENAKTWCLTQDASIQFEKELVEAIKSINEICQPN